MAYSPPTGNALIFNFVTAGGYTPPSGSIVVFNFGATPTPPPQSQALPTGKSQTFREDEWFFVGPKRPTPPIIASGPVPFCPRQTTVFDEPEWMPPPRRVFAVISAAAYVSRRRVLFTVT